MAVSVMLEAGAILLREGLEALLVVAALGMYLRRAGGAGRMPALYAGAGAGVVVSLALAWVFHRFFAGAHNDLLEGVVFLLAAALMLYVCGWLVLRADSGRMRADLAARAEAALASRSAVWAVGALAFLAVLREGAETVLFLHALALKGGGWSLDIVAGIALAAALLVALFLVFQGVAARLPLRPLFLLTSAFLFAMALKFIGDGLREFQEMAWIPFTPVEPSAWLEACGLNPSVEALAAQLAVAAAAAATFLWRRRATAPTPARAG